MVTEVPCNIQPARNMPVPSNNTATAPPPDVQCYAHIRVQQGSMLAGNGRQAPVAANFGVLASSRCPDLGTCARLLDLLCLLPSEPYPSHDSRKTWKRKEEEERRREETREASRTAENALGQAIILKFHWLYQPWSTTSPEPTWRPCWQMSGWAKGLDKPPGQQASDRLCVAGESLQSAA